MSENLSDFLVDLASNPDRMAAFTGDPVGTVEGAGLTEEEQAAVLSGDSRHIARRLGPQKTDEIIENLEITRRRGPRKPSKKAPPKKKAPARKKKRAPARKKAPSRPARKRSRR
jgi:hypothetical protein